MDYDSDDKDSKRKSRNLSEKKRRDQFNLLVNELSSMISTTGRKMDKSTVLKSTISFLKSHNEFTTKSRVNEIQEEWKPTFLTNEEFIHLILEAVDGFIIVFSTSGHIHYASESITSLLGHMPSDVVEMSLYDMTIVNDKEKLYSILANPLELETPLSFSCHLKRGALKSHDPVTYELINFIGYFRSDDEALHESQGYTDEEETRYVFVGTGRTQTPLLIKEIPLVDLHRTEFTSRHSLEWKFLFLDHRAPPIIGYLPFELLGTSGYEYYHVDDLENVINCHKALMQKGEGTSCHYRFLTKGQQWIWLQTRFFITYHQWNSKPEFIVCTHQVVSYTEVAKQARKDWSEPQPTNKPVLNVCDNLDFKCKRRGGGSDCTSMTADSPGSFGPQQSTASNNIDNVEQTQFQADLQKKQNELQIIIDQQQQELRRVSEQLLMAKLGLIHQQQQQQEQREKSPQPSSQVVSSCQASSSSMVSSTTTARTGSVIVPTTQPHAHQAQPHQQQFYQPDSNSKHI